MPRLGCTFVSAYAIILMLLSQLFNIIPICFNVIFNNTFLKFSINLVNNRVPLSFLLSFIRRPLVMQMQTRSRVRFRPTLTQGKMTHAGDKRNRVIARRLFEPRIIADKPGFEFSDALHLQRVTFLSLDRY